jgi:hypothetical protein
VKFVYIGGSKLLNKDDLKKMFSNLYDELQPSSDEEYKILIKKYNKFIVENFKNLDVETKDSLHKSMFHY